MKGPLKPPLPNLLPPRAHGRNPLVTIQHGLPVLSSRYRARFGAFPWSFNLSIWLFLWDWDWNRRRGVFRRTGGD